MHAVLQDMHLFFRNIVVYNGAASEFGKLSNKVEKCFEDHWAASGLAGGPQQGVSLSARSSLVALRLPESI